MIKIEKWYCDHLDGDAVHINYLSTLKIAGFRLGFEGVYDHSVGDFDTKFLPHSDILPTISGASLIWPGNTNGSSHCWDTAVSRPKVLHEIGEGKLTWNPLVLNEMANGHGSHGYVEQLVLEFAPWRLGLKELLWGHFCGERHSLVWIQWTGEINFKMLLLDGREAELTTLDDNTVVGTDICKLEISDHQLLYDKNIKQHIFGNFPFPNWGGFAHFLSGREKKQVATGVLSLAGSPPDEGHVFCEKVSW